MTTIASTGSISLVRTGEFSGLLARPALPRPLTPLIGRERELTVVRDVLADPRVRLITLTGAGGVGKTRLALDLAHAAADHFLGRVWFIPLAALADPHLVVATIAEVLGLPAAGEGETIERLSNALGSDPTLFVLDNLEHLVSAAPGLAGLLEACSGLRLLVTSREALRIRGEREVHVPPLALPEGESLTADEAGRFEAVALYVQRTREVRPDFALTDDNAAAVVEICRRLDGLPLAIELAAARGRVLPPSVLAGRMGQRLALLTGGARDLPARQQKMRDTIAWSYDLLPEEEQIQFRRLAVFTAGFSLEAAEAIVGSEAFDVIGSLLEKSLIREVALTSAGPRYAMLETIREFGHDQLRVSGEADEVRRRHADWYGELAEACWTRLYNQPIDEDFLAEVDAEHDDIRSALSWLEQIDDLPAMAKLAGAIGPLWYFRSHRSEGLAWLRRCHRRLPDPRVPPAITARVIHMTGSLAEGNPEAIDLLRESARIWESIGDRWGVAASGYEIARHSIGLGDDRTAAAYLEAAIPVFAEFGSIEWLADSTTQLGATAFAEGRIEEAFAHIERALVMGRATDDWYGIGVAVNMLGLVAAESGDLERAATAYREGLDAWTRVGNKEGMIWSLAGIAMLAAKHGRHELAARLFAAAENLAAAIGYRIGHPLLDRVDRARAATRDALGEAAYGAAYKTGRTAPLGSSIAAAVEFTEHPLAGGPAVRSPSARSGDENAAGLTPRELEVLRLLAEGRTDREIGELLVISRATAARHVANILLKLDVNSRTQAAAYAFRQGLT